MSRLYAGKVYAEYAQFYLNQSDSSSERFEGIWTEEASALHLGVAEGIIAVGTSTKHGYVAVEVWLFDQRPALDITSWDQIVEASITTTSGALELSSISSEIPIPTIDGGSYRVRVLSDGVAQGEEVGVGGDQYRLELWPEPPSSPKAVKLFNGWPR